MIWLLIAIATICAGYDFQVSKRRLTKYGLAAESNSLTRWLCANVGLQSGLLASIGVIHAVFSALALAYGWDVAYALYTGMKLNHFYLQLCSLQLERELDEEIRRQGGASKPTPPLG